MSLFAHRVAGILTKPTAAAAPTVVGAQGFSGDSFTSGVRDTPAGQASSAGNTMLWIGHNYRIGMVINSVTDSAAGSWTRGPTAVNADNSTVEVWYRTNVPAGITSVDYNKTGAGFSYTMGIMFELTGGIPQDLELALNGFVTSHFCAPAPGVSSQIALAIAGGYASNATGTWAPGEAGWAQRLQGSNRQWLMSRSYSSPLVNERGPITTSDFRESDCYFLTVY